jgi:hypothetical protein
MNLDWFGDEDRALLQVLVDQDSALLGWIRVIVPKEIVDGVGEWIAPDPEKGEKYGTHTPASPYAAIVGLKAPSEAFPVDPIVWWLEEGYEKPADQDRFAAFWMPLYAIDGMLELRRTPPPEGWTPLPTPAPT